MPLSQPVICHVIYRLTIGGLENGLVNLINNLPEARYRHAIVCTTEATEFRDRINRRDVEIHELRKRPGKDMAAYGRMWRILQRLRPRIIHTRNLPALDMIVPACLSGVPRYVHSEHGLDMIELDGRNRKYNLMRQASRMLINRYVTVSRDLSDWLRREVHIPAARVETIYNGVDTTRFSPESNEPPILPPGFSPPGSIIIGTLGRFDTVKNQVLLAQAVGCLLIRRPELRQRVRLVIIGNGKERGMIEAAVAAADMQDITWMPGFRDDTPAVYRALDVFVLPSLREGISNTLLEAMASARPVIATRIGGNPEIVPDGIVGQLVEPNDPDALAETILSYIDRPALLRAHGQAGRHHVLENFSLHAMVRRYDSVYASLL